METPRQPKKWERTDTTLGDVEVFYRALIRDCPLIRDSPFLFVTV